MRRVGVLAWPRPGGLSQVRAAETAAGSLGFQPQVVEVQEPSQYERVLDALKRDGADALLVCRARSSSPSGNGSPIS